MVNADVGDSSGSSDDLPPKLMIVVEVLFAHSVYNSSLIGSNPTSALMHSSPNHITHKTLVSI
jgi:hypothetical protein